MIQFCLVLCLGTIGLYLFFRDWSNRRRADALLGDAAGWPTLPFIGNAHQFYGGPEVAFRLVSEFSAMAEKHNTVVKIWFGPQLCIVVHNPEDVKILTNSFVDKPYFYNFGRIWLGNGLVTGPAAIWKKSIKKIGGTFTTTVVDGFQDIFNYQARKLVENMKREAGQPPFDNMAKYLAYATLETICQTALGCPDISDRIITSEYYEAFNTTLELLIKRGFNIFLHPECIFRLTNVYTELKKSVSVLHNVSNTVVAKRKKELQSKRSTEQNTNEKSSKFKPFLDILLEPSESDPSLTDEQIRAEVDTVIVGGQETTATTLQFALLMIGCHPHIQEKLYQEIKDVLGDSKQDVQKDDLPKLSYCEAVINESLRLFPPIPCVMRYMDSDVVLADGRTVPAGAGCVINAWGSGRSARLWGPDALDFKPERWLHDSDVSPAAFLAFSYGRRSCIGKKYAMNLLKTALAHSVRSLEFSSEAHKLKFKYDLALRATEGHLIQVQLRT